jgi:hypothetical protein
VFALRGGVARLALGAAVALASGCKDETPPRPRATDRGDPRADAPAYGAPSLPVPVNAAPGRAAGVSVVDVDGIPTTAVVTMDGQTTGATHFTFPRGTTHTLGVTAPGMLPYENRFTVDENDRAIAVRLAPTPVAPTATPPSR